MRMKEKGKGGEVCGLFFLSFQRRVKPIVKKRFDFLLSFPPLLIMLQKPSMNDCRKKVSGHVRKKKEKHCLYRAEQTLTYICIFFIKKKSTALPGGFYRIVKEKHIHLWSCGTTNLYSAIDGMNTVCTAVKKKKKDLNV